MKVGDKVYDDLTNTETTILKIIGVAKLITPDAFKVRTSTDNLIIVDNDYLGGERYHWEVVVYESES